MKIFNTYLAGLLCGIFLISVSCQTNQEKVEVVLKKCESFLEKDELDKATICYADAIKSDPENAGEISEKGKKAFFSKCNFYKEREDYERAIICYEGFSVLEPNFANNYFQLADSYFKLYQRSEKSTGQIDFDLLNRSAKSIENGLKINPTDATAFALRGEVYKGKRDLKEALLSYKRVVELDPETGIFWIKLGNMQVEMMQDSDAVKSYKEALRLNSNDKLALYYLGLQYIRTNARKEAIEVFEKLLKLDPTDKEIRQKLELLRNGKSVLEISSTLQ